MQLDHTTEQPTGNPTTMLPTSKPTGIPTMNPTRKSIGVGGGTGGGSGTAKPVCAKPRIFHLMGTLGGTATAPCRALMEAAKKGEGTEALQCPCYRHVPASMAQLPLFDCNFDDSSTVTP